MKTRNRGFTLIEIMVVVVILGILAAVVVKNIADRPDEAAMVRVKTDIRAIEDALELYKLDNFTYPTTEQGLEALVKKPTTTPEPKRYKQGGYIKNKIPKDPWGNDYKYLSPGTHGNIDVYSLGKSVDSAEDDVGNWSLDN